jgi:hypothetical protein
MSHSYKHTPIMYNASNRGNKEYKKYVWHRERAKLRECLSHGDYESIECRLQLYDSWDAPGDGKGWEDFKPYAGFGVHQPKFMQEYNEEFYRNLKRKMMRK